MKKFLLGLGLFVGAPLLIIIVGMAALTLLMQAGTIPSTAVITGDRLSSQALRSIAENVSLRRGESIEYFYSTAMFDWGGDGNVITNQRVIAYLRDDNGSYVEQADYADIARVLPEFQGDWGAKTTLTILTKDGREFYLLLSNEDDLDHAAVEYVAARVQEARGE